METSLYQSLKIVLISFVPLAKDAYHIYIGFFCFLLILLFIRRSRGSYLAVLPIFLISIIMELLDIHDDFVSLGYIRWTDSIKDIINTNLIPFIITVFIKNYHLLFSKETMFFDHKKIKE